MILPYDIRENIVWIDTRTAYTLIDSVASGRKPMQMVGSPSGFAKTSMAKKSLKKHGLVPENKQLSPLAIQQAIHGTAQSENMTKRIFIETRPNKPISLVRVLFRCATLNAAALLFDDPGKIAADEDSCDILKTAFGIQHSVSHGSPAISRNEQWRISGHRGYDPFLPPPEFSVPSDLRWLWLTNTNFTDPEILAKLGDHFLPLIARGLNPFWIRDDREHDNYALFLYVVWLATDQNLLRGLGFSYQVSRQAVNFYVTHANRLIDLCPRRLELIAQAFAAKQPAAALEAQLTSMLTKDGNAVRPELKVEQSWVTVPGGTLLWPEQPFSKLKLRGEDDSPRRIRKRERVYKRRHEQPRAAPACDYASPAPPSAASKTSPVAPPEPAPLQASALTGHQHKRDEEFAERRRFYEHLNKARAVTNDTLSGQRSASDGPKPPLVSGAKVTDNAVVTARTQMDSELEPDLARLLDRQKEIAAALHRQVVEQDQRLHRLANHGPQRGSNE